MNKTILAFDTNIWLYLIKPEFLPILETLIRYVEKDEIEIIVNDIIITEWERNKETNIKRVCESIKQEYISAMRLSAFIENDEERQKYTEILSHYKKEEERLQHAKMGVKKVERLLQKCTNIVASESQKLYIANLAINKKPPFSNNKNNFNDALIIRNIAETITRRIINEGSALPYKYDLIYVSNNLKDFIDSETNEIYTELLEGCERLRIISIKDLTHALKIRDELIDDFDEWLEQMIEMHAELEAEIMRGK